jgi:hypothetical protein
MGPGLQAALLQDNTKQILPQQLAGNGFSLTNGLLAQYNEIPAGYQMPINDLLTISFI